MWHFSVNQKKEPNSRLGEWVANYNPSGITIEQGCPNLEKKSKNGDMLFCIQDKQTNTFWDSNWDCVQYTD